MGLRDFLYDTNTGLKALKNKRMSSTAQDLRNVSQFSLILYR